MPKNPGPIRPRRFDERAYERALRSSVLDPLFRQFGRGLNRAQTAKTAFDELKAAEAAALANLDPTGEAAQQMVRLNDYHRQKLITTFRSALGVNVAGLLAEEPVRSFLRKKIGENVDLIKSIPKASHEGLKQRLIRELNEAPFDRERLTTLLRQEYQSAGYRLRRLARDQTTKTIGGLTEIRHRQMGVEWYRWSTSLDERVRPTHDANESLLFRWDDPPVLTGHPGQDIQCFPGSARILPAGLQASVAYRYVGEVVEIRLANGVDVTLTPNHPVLTEAGWKRAGDVDEGDELLEHTGGRCFATARLYPDFGDGYLFAEQLHRLLGGRVDEDWTQGRSVDLHGHPAGRDEEVDVVAAPRELRDRFDSLGLEVLGDFGLELADVHARALSADGTAMTDLQLPPGVAGLFVRGSREGASLVGRQPGHADGVRFGTGPRTEAQVQQARPNHVATDAEVVGDLFGRLLGLPGRPDGGMKSESAFVVSRVAGRRRRHYDGLLYDVETTTGLVVVNGIVTHNCRCVALAQLSDRDRDRIKGAATGSGQEAPAAPATTDPPPPARTVQPKLKAGPSQHKGALDDVTWHEFGVNDIDEFTKLADYKVYEDLPAAAKKYFGTDYDDLNYRLRKGLELANDQQRIMAELLDEMAPLTERRVVYRGMKDLAVDDPVHALQVGDEITMTTPTSTSLRPKTSRMFASNEKTEGMGVMFELHTDDGVVGLMTNAYEYEIVMRPGQRIVVDKILDDAVPAYMAYADEPAQNYSRYIIGRIVKE